MITFSELFHGALYVSQTYFEKPCIEKTILLNL